MGTYLGNTLKADGLQIGVAYGMMATATEELQVAAYNLTFTKINLLASYAASHV